MTTSLRLAIWSASLGAWFIVSGTFLFSTRSLYHLISAPLLLLHTFHLADFLHTFQLHVRSVAYRGSSARLLFFHAFLLALSYTRSSFIVCVLHIFYLCFRTWRSAFPSFLQFIKKKKVQWVTGDSMLWPSFCFQNGAFSSHPPRPLLLSGQPHPKREWVRIDSLKKSICSGICCAGANAGASYLRTLFLETHSTHLSVFCSFVGSNEAQRGTRYSHPDHEYYTDMIPHWLPSLVMGVVGFACSHKGPLK